MKRLTLEELLTMERLTNQQYTLTGTPRKRPRTWRENDRLKIPKQHQDFLRGPIRSSKLRELLAMTEK